MCFGVEGYFFLLLFEFWWFWTHLSYGGVAVPSFFVEFASTAGEGDEVVAEDGASDAGSEILKSFESASVEFKGAF